MRWIDEIFLPNFATERRVEEGEVRRAGEPFAGWKGKEEPAGFKRGRRAFRVVGFWRVKVGEGRLMVFGWRVYWRFCQFWVGKLMRIEGEIFLMLLEVIQEEFYMINPKGTWRPYSSFLFPILPTLTLGTIFFLSFLIKFYFSLKIL